MRSLWRSCPNAHLSTRRAWSWCLISVNNMRSNDWPSSKRLSWISNDISTSQKTKSQYKPKVQFAEMHFKISKELDVVNQSMMLCSKVNWMWRFVDTFVCCSYASVYRDFERTILAANTQEDLKWFSNNHGPDMHMNWPQFEVWSLQCTSWQKILSNIWGW